MRQAQRHRTVGMPRPQALQKYPQSRRLQCQPGVLVAQGHGMKIETEIGRRTPTAQPAAHHRHDPRRFRLKFRSALCVRARESQRARPSRPKPSNFPALQKPAKLTTRTVTAMSCIASGASTIGTGHAVEAEDATLRARLVCPRRAFKRAHIRRPSPTNRRTPSGLF